jgi:hypothetical protein
MRGELVVCTYRAFAKHYFTDEYVRAGRAYAGVGGRGLICDVGVQARRHEHCVCEPAANRLFLSV